MKRFYYDLHVHSCLSPCGDEDNTPNNIAGMALLGELDIVALTDHNTVKNCPAFFEACEKLGIVAVAGMELTTSEDIHVVCLFEKLSDAQRFDEAVDERRMKIKNKPEFFGEQLILNGQDEVVGSEPFLLSAATEISIDDVAAFVRSYGGICYPAHIDRDSNGIIAVLGTIPHPNDFDYFELHDKSRIEEFSLEYGIDENKFIISSDSHNLGTIAEKDNYFMLECGDDPDEVRRALFELLGGNCH